MTSTKKQGPRVKKDRKPPTAEPVHNEPAAIINRLADKPGNSLILADLHYGIEYTLKLAGAQLPSQTENITKRVIDLCERFSVTELILLGDIKHTVPTTSRQEWHELPRVFEQFSEVVDNIEIIPGNHDGNLHRLVPEKLANVHFHRSSGAVLHGIGFFHGHTWPSEDVLTAAQIFMAHNHPNVLFIDKLGGRASYSCWLRACLDNDSVSKRYSLESSADHEIIVMPAFNDIGSGTPVNTSKPEFLGPMLRNKYINLDTAKVYLLDGTDLGKLGKLTKISDNST